LQAEQKGDWDSARKEFDAAKSYQDAAVHAAKAQQNAATVSAAYDRGNTAFNNQQWNDALAQFNAVLALSPSYKDAAAKRAKVTQQLDALVSDGSAKLASGDFQGAQTAYKAAGSYQGSNQKASDAGTAAGAYDAAQKDIAAQKWWEAYSQLAIVVKLDPGFKDAQTQLQTAQGKLDGFIADGDAKLKAGDIKGAIDAYAQAGGYQQADQKVSALNAKITRLDGLYGQMTANAQAGNWADALDEASSILSDTPSYRDVKAKRDGYLEQIYAAAGIAESQSDWKEVIRLYGILQAKEPNYKDVNEKLAAARIAAVPKPGTVVYEADWSKGLSGWTNTGGWRSLNGMLINDGSNTDHGEWKASWVPAPFDLSGMTNYAVEVEAQILTIPGCGDFKIVARSSYEGGIGTCNGGNSVAIVSLNGDTMDGTRACLKNVRTIVPWLVVRPLLTLATRGRGRRNRQSNAGYGRPSIIQTRPSTTVTIIAYGAGVTLTTEAATPAAAAVLSTNRGRSHERVTVKLAGC